MQEARIDRDGLQLRYLEWNQEETRRPAMLLLHGLSSNAHYWGRLAGSLTGRRIVALDQRGHGASAAPATGYEPSSLAADAAALVERLELGRVVVAGHSWGASIALQLAADRPDLVSGLAVIDGPVRSMAERMSWEQASSMMQPPLPVYLTFEDAVAEKRAFLKGAWDEDLMDFVRAGLVPEGAGFRLPMTTEIRYQILHGMYFQGYEVQWAQVRCPVLLELAGQDAAGSFQEFKKRSAAEIEAQVEDVVTHWFETGHDIPVEAPAAVAADLERLCLRAGFADVATAIRATEGEWDQPTGYRDWSAKDLLAHLASSHTALPAIALSRPAPGAEPGPPFDPDRWNAAQIRRRLDRTPAELKEELTEAEARLRPVLADLSLDDVVASGTFAGNSAMEVMRYMTDHQRGHLAELSRTLSASSPKG